MRIVVVEDEKKSRRGLIQLIGRISSNYLVVGEADNGLYGIEVILREKPDLVIVDIKMPQMNGLDMLQQLREKGLKIKAIVLSGFSDFNFAQKAIKLGIYEYLLKPITVEELKETLINIEKEIETEKLLCLKSSQGLSSINNSLQRLALESAEETQSILLDLKVIYGVNIDDSFTVITVYLGDNMRLNKEAVDGILKERLDRFEGIDYYIFQVDVHNEIVVLINGKENFSELEKYTQNVILKELHRKNIMNVIMGWIPFEGLHNLKDSLTILRKELKWSIVLGEDVLVSYPKTQKIHTNEVQYPVDIENKTKAAAYSLDVKALQDTTQEFLNWWRKDLFRPSEVIEAFLCFESAIINVLKEVDYELFSRINQKETLKKVMDSLTWGEIKGTLTEIVEKVSAFISCNEKVYSLTIKKALSIINRQYMEGITLDEVASKLRITPVYLSTLFNREVGQNFSVYIKEFRIYKAKELLIKSNLKTYEIAERVGYSDPKYFSRVFKEISGFSPGEYQKAYKA